MLKGYDKHRDSPFYPAHTYDFPVLAYHHSVLVNYRGGWEETQPGPNVLRLKPLRPDGWSERNEQLRCCQSHNQRRLQQAEESSNPTRVLGIVAKGIRMCLGDQSHTYSASSWTQQLDPASPYLLRPTPKVIPSSLTPCSYSARAIWRTRITLSRFGPMSEVTIL